MKRTAITLSLFIVLTGFSAMAALAQPVRNGVDVVWARDVAGATMTLDGNLDEAVWQQAETVPLVWNQSSLLPGGGQKIEGNPVPAEPTDPNNGMLYVLRDGNVLWLGLMVQDKSIGGGTSLWNFDGIIMSITDRSQRPTDFASRTDANYFANAVTNSEWILSWWNPADTSDATTTYDDGTLVGSGLPMPGMDLRLFGDYGVGFSEGNVERSPEDIAVLDAAATVDGIVNDDTHGDDTGYTMEVRIDLGLMGYDFSQAGGDNVPWNIALQDDDYSWPADPDLTFLSRVWWQNQWANNFNDGVAFIYGAPDVTINSGDVPEVTQPEFTIPNAGSFGAPTVDGSLDEDVWSESDTLFYLQYEAEPPLLGMNPGTLAPYHMSWFRPDINGDNNAAVVVDPSMARVKMVFEGDILYIGVDVDDQAISGSSGEGGRDGIRFTIREVDSLNTNMAYPSKQFDVYIDSSGTAQLALAALDIAQEDPTAIQAVVAMKGASTVADPTDIDEGYQLEIAIDLVKALGYPTGLGDGRLWLSANFFDGDFLETQEASYATRTWMIGERGDGASLYGYLNASSSVAVEDAAEIPESIRLMGNYPNPFNPVTTLRYALPQAGVVRVQVFDVLGRRLAVLSPGLQAAGTHELPFDATQYASGMYLYRVEVLDQAGDRVRASRVGRMILVK